MKARVKKTGEIVELADDCYLNNKDYEHSYYVDELESIEFDYWEKLKHQYAGMAMQGLLSNTSVTERELTTRKGIIEDAERLATALVQKLKEEK